MGDKPRVLAFAGSLRRESTNHKLLEIAAEGARGAGAEVTVIRLRDYPLPLYDQEIEDTQGLPENALKLKELMMQHEGLLIASPEYNSSITGNLKNTIDWISRKASPDEASLSAFKGKVAALVSTSPGGLGGLRGLVHLRSILENINVMVIPPQKTIPNGYEAFNDQGKLKDKKATEAVVAVSYRLVEVLSKLK